MAENEALCTSTNFKHPRIVFIRLGSEKTKDDIQNKIFKGVRKALKDLGNKDRVSKPDKNVLVLSSVIADSVLDIAIGEQYVGLLLKDGRVCRFKCVCKNVRPCTKGKSTDTADEQSFQAQGDGAYARRLAQDRPPRLSNESCWRNGNVNDATETPFGLVEQPFRFGSLTNESDTPTDDPLLNFSDPHLERMVSDILERNTFPFSQVSHSNNQNRGDQTKHSEANDAANTSNVDSSSSKASSVSGTNSDLSSNSDNLKGTLSKSSTSAEKSAGTLPGNSKSDTVLDSSKSTSEDTPVNQPHRSTSVSYAVNTRLLGQSSINLQRQPPSSPTVVQRTIVTADRPLMYTPFNLTRFAPARVPSLPRRLPIPDVHYGVGRREGPLSTAQRRILQQRFFCLQQNQDGLARSSRRENSEHKVKENSNGDFDYPEAGDIEWLQTESGEDLRFSHITALHTEFVLVEKGTGCLYHWPYHSDATIVVAMDTDVSDTDLRDISSSGTPKANVTDLLDELNLHDEQVVLIASQKIRCTFVTKSGKICTFYDRFFKESNNGVLPQLIQQLSHPAILFPELQGEVITAVDCSEFFSTAMTQSGKIYWWGLLPSEERQAFKHKQNKDSHNISNISLNDKVQLRKHLPGFPGALVFRSSERFGPQLGRLLSHETDSSTQVAVKIKVEKIIDKYSSRLSSRSNSPVTSVPSRMEVVLAKGSASPMHTIAQEARSGSPHTNIKNLDNKSCSNSNIEEWDISDIVFLESESKVLGTVAAIDGPHVIVQVDSSNITSDSSLRVFKLSELESVSDQRCSLHVASTSTFTPVSTMYRGCIQDAPKCILDATRSSSSTDKDVITGVKPLAVMATSVGVSTLVEHKETHQAIFIGPAGDSSNGQNVITCCEDMTTAQRNDKASITVEYESVPSKEGALDFVPLCPDTLKIGQKRKHPARDDITFLERNTENAIVQSRVKRQDARIPSLHKCSVSNAILLCDNNTCLYPRPFGTKLSEPCAVEMPPLRCLGIGQCRGFTSKCDADENILAVFLAFKEQKLIRAIQSAIVYNVIEVLKELEDIHLKNQVKSKGRKKQAYDGDNNQPFFHSLPQDEESSQDVPLFSQEVLDVVNEHTSSNQNVLHVACRNPAYLVKREDAEKPMETLLKNLEDSADYGKRSDFTSLDCVEVSIIDRLLYCKVFACKFVPMLKERDAKGCTPFMLAMQCRNFKGAWYILDFVSKYQGKYYGDCKISMETMIFPPTLSNITPLHALAIACSVNLPASGLGNSLTVSNLPSKFTPSMLLKLFQENYPSAYRATIPPMVEATKYPRAKTPRERILELAQKNKVPNTSKGTNVKKSTLSPSTATSLGSSASRAGPYHFREGGNRIPVINRRGESIQGMVTFSDTKELRQALVQMDKHTVSMGRLSAETGNLPDLIHYVLHVKLTELELEDTERLEMEVGIRGDVYNVSTSSGTTKISRKPQKNDTNKTKEMVIEDGLLCQLFARLLSYSKLATARNSDSNTVLSFMVNNSRWIKQTAQQKQRLTKYRGKLLGTTPETPKETQADHNKEASDITAEIKIKSSSGSSATIESNLLAQLDEISSSFRSLVDTLGALENRGAGEENGLQTADAGKDLKDKEPTEEGTSGTQGGIMDMSTDAPSGDVPDNPDESLPVLIQLAQNWPCVAATVMGYTPKVIMENYSEGLGRTRDMGPKDISGAGTKCPAKNKPDDSCAIDEFVIELLTNADKSVLVTFVETIIKEMNKHRTELTLEASQRIKDLGGPLTASELAIAVGMKFLRSVIRQMSVHLSRSGVSYLDLKTRLFSGSQSSPVSLDSNAEVKQRARMIIKSFSWLGIYELVQAAEAIVLTVREGVPKPQATSTKASSSNAGFGPNICPAARFRGPRPGIRVSQFENRSTNHEAVLRTAFRIRDDSQTTSRVQCRGTRLATLSEDSSTPRKRTPSPSSLSMQGILTSNQYRTSTIDSDSDTDEETNTVFRDIMDEDTDLDELGRDPSSLAALTGGLSREHPYAWALDGRLLNFGENTSTLNVTQYIESTPTTPSVHAGKCYLTCMYSRLVKEAVDVMMSLQPRDGNSRKDNGIVEEPVLPVLNIIQEECTNIQDCVTSLLNTTWVWLAKILDVVEGQLQRGSGFDTKRYLSSVQRLDINTYDFAMGLSRSPSSVSGASSEEYLMFLLRSHSNEHSDTLPVIDMCCYEHMVHILDSFIYCVERSTKQVRVLNRSSSSISSVDEEEASSIHLSMDFNRTNSEPGTSNPQPNLRRMRSKEHEETVKFFGMNVYGKAQGEFLQNLEATLLKKSRMLVPKVTWEVFAHNVGAQRTKSVDEVVGKTGSGVEQELPVSMESVSKTTYPYPLVQNWSADEIINRWKISVDLFSRLFLADGPGAERDSFLAARAGVASRLARFRWTIFNLRSSVPNEAQHQRVYNFIGGGMGSTLSIGVTRNGLVEETLRILGEMQPFHYSNFRAKFDGEEGSGPGVNRGFFAAMANALKTDNKLPPDTASLLHEPGKLPEQSGFYAPKPWTETENVRNGAQLKARRFKMFTSIGRFLGLSLWFNNTVPLNFSRQVVKVLLDREVTWEDLIFFNADLFEGLSRMMIDAAHPSMTSERFQATYCCHFETSVGGSTEELLPGGSQLPVTPENIFKYVRLYASKVMTGCVQEELRHMRNGLHDIIPTELLATLSPEDFQLLLSGGTTGIDISKLKSLVVFSNSNGCPKNIMDRFKRWFWSIVQKMTPLQRQQLLYFCTGSAVLPVMGDFRDPVQDLTMTIDVIGGSTKALPTATTCGQRMSIPLYPSKRILKKKLLQAIQCQSYGLG